MKGRFRRLWARLWPTIGGVSLRVKIMGIALLMIAVLGLGLTVQTRTTLARNLEREIEQRALSVARDLAFRSTDLILTNNLYSLYVLTRETVRNNEDVRYAFVVDLRGNLLAHSFEGGFPPDLLTANRVEAGEPYHREVLQTEEGLIQDIAVPVFGGRAGTVVSIILERRGDTVVLIVEDDGRGFDVKEAMAAQRRGHLGLSGMAERASLVGGRLTVESAPGAGAMILLEVPIGDGHRRGDRRFTRGKDGTDSGDDGR